MTFMNQTKENSQDNIDLFFVFRKTNELYKTFLISIFRALSFFIKNWIIILILIVAGLIFGFFSQKNYEAPKEMSALIRINFGTGNYVYSSVDLLNEKINNRDSIFLKNLKLWKNNSSIIRSVAIEPVINFKKLIEDYGPSNRTFEILLDNYDFDGNNSASETFIYDYKYHKMTISLDPSATSVSVSYIIDYLNKNEILQILAEEGIYNIQDRINSNTEMISQINGLIDTYTNNQMTSGNTSEPIVLDKDISGLIDKKRAIQSQLEAYREEKVVSKNIVVMISKADLVQSKTSFFKNKLILYPAFLLFIFITFSVLKRIFLKAKRLSELEKM